MSTNPNQTQKSTGHNWQQMTVPFNKIQEPGAYYYHGTGALFRVPSEAVSQGHSPIMNFCSTEEPICTKISDDPWVPLNKAREICANSDFCVDF
jgi:hypothetical protein